MSTDGPDASDMMASNENSESAGVTRLEAFSEKKLQKLRNEAVQGVAGGAYPLDVVSLDGHTGDGAELVDGENEAFRESVREQLGDGIDDEATEEEEAEEGEGWDPTEVDFNTIWNEYNFPKKVSNVQLTEALAVSDHTGFRRGGAERAIEYGIEAGTLIDIPRRLPDDCRGEEVVATGVMYAAGEER